MRGPAGVSAGQAQGSAAPAKKGEHMYETEQQCRLTPEQWEGVQQSMRSLTDELLWHREISMPSGSPVSVAATPETETCQRAGCHEPQAKAGLCQRHWDADMREMLGAMDGPGKSDHPKRLPPDLDARWREAASRTESALDRLSACIDSMQALLDEARAVVRGGR